jgi:tetratricopeptide (TPR) repeat protein
MSMSMASEFLLYLTAFRLAIIAAGTVSIVLGYRLFVRGVFSPGIPGQDVSVEAHAGGSGFTLRNAAPGTGFGLFGVLLIVVMLVQGSPELTYETLKKASGSEEASGSAKLVMRGGDTPDSFTSLVNKGLSLEKAGESAQAMDAYKRALSIVAVPMNQLAWLYLQQHQADSALPLARLAAQLSPDNPAFLDTLAETLAQRGERAEAVSWMEKAAALDLRYREKLAGLRSAKR